MHNGQKSIQMSTQATMLQTTPGEMYGGFRPPQGREEQVEMQGCCAERFCNCQQLLDKIRQHFLPIGAFLLVVNIGLIAGIIVLLVKPPSQAGCPVGVADTTASSTTVTSTTVTSTTVTSATVTSAKAISSTTEENGNTTEDTGNTTMNTGSTSEHTGNATMNTGNTKEETGNIRDTEKSKISGENLNPSNFVTTALKKVLKIASAPPPFTAKKTNFGKRLPEHLLPHPASPEVPYRDVKSFILKRPFYNKNVNVLRKNVHAKSTKRNFRVFLQTTKKP